MNERVRELRKYLNLTLKEFGEKLGVQSAAINKIEKGTVTITEQMFKSICREYNVNETWLRTGDGDMFVDIDEEEEITQWVSEALGHKDASFQRRFVKMLMGLTIDQWSLLEQKIHELYAEQVAEEKAAASVKAAEVAYIKSRSNSAPKMGSSVSSTTTGTDN